MNGTFFVKTDNFSNFGKVCRKSLIFKEKKAKNLDNIFCL